MKKIFTIIYILFLSPIVYALLMKSPPKWSKNIPLITILALLSCLALSCGKTTLHSNSPAGTTKIASEIIRSEQQNIRRFCDRILLSLATHKYKQLATMLEPANQTITGSQVAQRLLGPQVRSLILDHWDAQNIIVSLDSSLCQALAQAVVAVKSAPNRKPQNHKISFRFHRSHISAPWHLVLP